LCSLVADHRVRFLRRCVRMSKPWPWTHTTEPNNRVGPTPTSSVGITRDLGRARDAYKKRGVEASRAAHDGVRPSHELRRSSTSTDTATDTASSRSEISELPPSDRYRPALPPIVGTRRALEKHSNTPSEYIKSMVFGGLDGIITTFAVVAAVAGAELSADMVTLMGVANLVSDGISMGLGDYLSERSEKDYIHQEWKRETWEFENYPEGEKKEMVELYVEEGMAEADATIIVNAFSKYPEKFVNLMMVDELGLEKWDPQDLKGLWKQGAITMCSFWFFGGIPVVTYAVVSAAGVASQNLIFLIDCLVTLLTMFLLGAAKAKVTNTSMLFQGGVMMLNGTVACGASYFIAWAISEIMGETEMCGDG